METSWAASLRLILARTLLGPALALVLACGDSPPRVSAPTNTLLTISMAGELDRSNPFFQSLGTNGRSCSSCHREQTAWTISPSDIQAVFASSDGLDPLFRKNDGANSPTMDDSSLEARRTAYSMLLEKGLIRVGIGIPANAEFELVAVDDPYGYATSRELSLFRRPAPATNLRFLSAVMWDGRETFPGHSIDFGLLHQSNEATLGHAQAQQPLSDEQRRQIVDFESSLFTAPIEDAEAGPLTEQGALGGPSAVSEQEFYLGINDVLGADPRGRPFNPKSFTLYSSWAELTENSALAEARRSVARGQELFETKEIHIVGVKGLNDALGISDLVGTCTTCHDAPNAGSHSVSLPVDIGLTTEAKRTPDMPLYTLRNLTTAETVKTTDPGRALVTGRWADIGKFKGPVLRGLLARPPYFHNGLAADLNAVVDFYNTRFDIHLTDSEKADLVAFLRVL